MRVFADVAGDGAGELEGGDGGEVGEGAGESGDVQVVGYEGEVKVSEAVAFGERREGR